MEYKYPAVSGGGGGGDANTAKSLVITVRNNTGVLIPKRTPVYINGALGNRPTIALANNTSDETSSKVLGLTVNDIANNVDGEVIAFGRLEKVDTSAFTPGQALWLGATDGAITATKPVAPNHMVFLGIVVISNPANGVIEVEIQNGFELEELHNVLITTPANNQTIIYDSATSLWKNALLPAGTLAPSAPDANKALVRDASGNVISAPIANVNIDANANIAVSKLASLTANKIAVTDGSGKLATNSGAVTDNEVVAYNAGTLYTVAGVTNTKVGYLSNVTSDIQAQINSKLASTLKGAPNGLAELDGSGKVPSSQLPSYVDDVLEYANLAAFPVTGTDGVIYIALDTNLCYRWGGSTYVEISPSLALGETATTAYRGDRGKIAYDHSQYMGNPHFTDISQISGVSSYALGLLNDTTAAEARTTLGLGTIATQNASSVTISGGSVNTTVSNRLRASLASLPISGGGLAATTGFVRLTAGETVLDTISDPGGILASSGVNLVLHNYTVGADVTITNAGNILTGTGDNIVLKQNASIAFVHNGNSKWSVVNYVTAGLTPSPLATTLSPAVKNTHYLTNTSGGAFSVTLPAGAAGSVIRFSDANETWDSYALTIIPATGEKLDNLATNESLICDVKRGWVELSWNTALSSWSLQSLAATDVVAASTTQAGVVKLKAPTQTKLTSGSGTYTVPTGVLYLKVKMVGGGGGGSGSGTSGGTGGTGGASTFGSSLLTANGGAGGQNGNSLGGAGGSSSIAVGTAGVAFSGGAGNSPAVNVGSNVSGGSGGSSAFGGNGGGAWGIYSPSAAPANTGGGGGGGGTSSTSVAGGSGGGAGGYVDALISAPAASYAYAVGAAGSAGAAGTSGYAGGAGGSGIIVIDEYYY